MPKEIKIVRRERNSAKIFVGESEIVAAQEVAKPKDRVVLDGENISWREGCRSQKTVPKDPEFRSKKIKPGSTQQRIRSITPKEKKTKKTEAYVDGSYLSDSVDITEHADGIVDQEEREKYPEYYKHEP